MNFTHSSGLIAIGIHSGTNYFDCSTSFFQSVAQIVEGYTDNTIQITAPFLTWSKKDIIQYCFLEGIPLELTYSCELGLQQPCSKCLTCKDLITIYDSTK